MTFEYKKSKFREDEPFVTFTDSIRANDEASALAMLEKNPSLMFGKTKEDATPLILACQYTDSGELVKAMLDVIPPKMLRPYMDYKLPWKRCGISFGSRTHFNALEIALFKQHTHAARAIVMHNNKAGAATYLSHCHAMFKQCHISQLTQESLPPAISVISQLLVLYQEANIQNLHTSLIKFNDELWSKLWRHANLNNITSLLELLNASGIFHESMSERDQCITVIRGSDCRDMAGEFADLFLLPSLLMEMRVPGESEIQFRDFLTTWPKEAQNELFDLSSRFFSLRSPQHVMGLSTSWHILGNGIPTKLRPIQSDNTWNPLFQNEASVTFKPSNNEKPLNICCLTSSRELVAESEALGHCVGRRSSYVNRCCEGKHHIFSIRSPEQLGKESILATLFIKKDADGKFVYADREAKVGNKLDAKTTPREFAASEWFLKELNAGRWPLNSHLGMSSETKAFINLPAVIKSIGFHPTPEAIEALFQEYNHKHMRRAAIAQDDSGRVSFDMDISKNRFIPDVTFTTADGRDITVGYQDLTAELFLAATGLREELHTIIRKHYPERATLLEPVWAEQPNAEALWRDIEAAKQRAKYAHNFKQVHPESSGARIAGRHANAPLPRIHQAVHGGRTGFEQEISIE